MGNVKAFLSKVDWKNIAPSTYARYTLMVMAVANSMLTTFGCNPLPFSEDETYEFVSNLATIILLVVNTWYNNSVTTEAIAADQYMNLLKSGQIPSVNTDTTDDDNVG